MNKFIVLLSPPRFIPTDDFYNILIDYYGNDQGISKVRTMKFHIREQHALKIVNNCLHTNNSSYLETSGGPSSNQYINVVHFFNMSIN
jgi:hypothetical protein